jgi:hypothetical protein
MVSSVARDPHYDGIPGASRRRHLRSQKVSRIVEDLLRGMAAPTGSPKNKLHL